MSETTPDENAADVGGSQLERLVMREQEKGVDSKFNACMFRGECRARKGAVEHGIYLANAAERLLAAVNNLDRVMSDENSEQDDIEDAEQARSEWWAGLQEAIHEFRKRA